METLGNIIGSRIKDARKKLGLTQKQLSERTGIPEITIRQYEAGKYLPKYERATCLAKELRIPAETLMGITLAPPSTEIAAGVLYDIFQHYGYTLYDYAEEDGNDTNEKGYLISSDKENFYYMSMDLFYDTVERIEATELAILQDVLESTKRIEIKNVSQGGGGADTPSPKG